MTNFTVKNHFKAENAKLVDATVGTWSYDRKIKAAMKFMEERS